MTVKANGIGGDRGDYHLPPGTYLAEKPEKQPKKWKKERLIRKYYVGQEVKDRTNGGRSTKPSDPVSATAGGVASI